MGVIGGVCVIVFFFAFISWGTRKRQQRKTNKKKQRGDCDTPSEQFLNTTAYGGLDFTHSPPPINGPTPSHSPTTFDFEASVAARDDAVATYNNTHTTHTSMTHEPTTTTTTTTPDATEGV